MNGREFNLGLLTKYEYGSRNLKPKPGTRPAACFKVRSPHKWEWLYREEDLETANPNLPAIYPSHALVPPHLKTQNQLKQIGLKPKDNAKPHACLWWATDWLFFYHQDECVAREAEYVCKSNLRTYYFLSKTWISRLGAPDLEIENPHGRKFAPMQLYNTPSGWSDGRNTLLSLLSIANELQPDKKRIWSFGKRVARKGESSKSCTLALD
jgi:hypothetical protein